MSAVMQLRYKYEDYLVREIAAEYKSEFYRGEIFAMSGGSPRHNRISLSIAAALKARLRNSPCSPYNSDQRIRIPANGLATYPDVSVVCGELRLDPVDLHAITNPGVIFEVLSKSSESYDRGKKFDLYRELETLQEYILIAQDEPQVERFVRQDNNSWNLTVIKGLSAVLEILSLRCSLSMSEVYEDVTFGPE